MSRIYPIHGDNYKYSRIIGTGGIGGGIFFSFDTDTTLGRNESRAAKLLPYRDYCKQHIILHYISVLLDTTNNREIEVHPIGKVGNDETGKRLVLMMESAGMKVNHVRFTDDAATLFSVCFQYPDYSGGNITTSNSASDLVSEREIINYFVSNPAAGVPAIVLSVPEVPVNTRIQLLSEGRNIHALNVSSLLSAEVDEFRARGGFRLTDLLAINIDEAAKIGYRDVENDDHDAIVRSCIEVLHKENKNMQVLITDGPNGAYCYNDNELHHYPTFKVDVVSTAGAGDAFIAGTICGLICGLPLTEKNEDESLSCAVQSGLLVAALSVTSPDTINTDINAKRLKNFALNRNVKFSEAFNTMLIKNIC